MTTITDLRPANRFYEIDGIPTVNLGVADLSTGRDAWRLMLGFFAGWTMTVGIHPWPGAQLTMADRCTCCENPRMVYRFGFDNDEWGHVDDETYAEVRHLHTESSSSDCDGRYSNARVTRLNSGIAKWALRPSRAMIGCENEEPTWHDLVTFCFEQTAGIWGGPTTIEVDASGDSNDGVPYMRWHTVTDEGGASGQVRVCNDPWCAYDDDEQRDHRAESMGY